MSEERDAKLDHHASELREALNQLLDKIRHAAKDGIEVGDLSIAYYEERYGEHTLKAGEVAARGHRVVGTWVISIAQDPPWRKIA